MIRGLETLSYQTVIVNLTIDRENDGVIRIGQWLSTRFWSLCEPPHLVDQTRVGPTNANDAKSLVA
jgi:hypothetical protein